jgi:hypothetical protein
MARSQKSTQVSKGTQGGVVGFGSEKQSNNLFAEGSLGVTLVGYENFRALLTSS